MSQSEADAALLQVLDRLDEIRACLPHLEHRLVLRTLCRIAEAGGGRLDITPTREDKRHFTVAVQDAVVGVWQLLEPAVDNDRVRLRSIAAGFAVELGRMDDDARVLRGVAQVSGLTEPGPST